ncbi:MAG: hypothetical protein ABEJ91_03730 [Candidatus Nanohaloarchaea archaeon]
MAKAKRDLISEYEQQLSGGKGTRTQVELVRRRLEPFNEMLKLMREDKPYMSSFKPSDLTAYAEMAGYDFDSVPVSPIHDFLEFAGVDVIEESEMGRQSYTLDADHVTTEETPIDDLLEDVETCYTVEEEVRTVEYALADLSRDLDRPTWSEIKTRAGELLGYELSKNQVMNRLESNDRVEANGTGGGIKTDYRFEDYSR